MMVGLLLAASLALAQDGGGVWTPQEEAVLASYRDEKLLTARRLAEELLAADPSSIPGNYVLGAVQAEAEGNLALSMRHLALARERYERTLLGTPGEHWRLHADLLQAIIQTAGEMEQERYQIQMLDYYDSLYDPNMTGEHAWPYMKLGELDEARRYVDLALSTGDSWQISVARNAHCAMESTRGLRAESHAACLAALEHERSLDPLGVNVAAYNASLSALSVFEHAQAEALALESGGAAGAFSNPWLVLVDLYLSEGRGEEAVQAAGAVQQWRARQPPKDRSHGRAESDAGTARLLLLAGETEGGLRLVHRALQFPDRMGSSSSQVEEALGANSLLRLTLHRVDDEVRAEANATRGWLGRLGAWLGSWLPSWRDWEDASAVRAVLSDSERLTGTIRPYVDAGLDAPPWMAAELVRVLGPGVVQQALRRAQRVDAASPAAQSYFAALQVEVDAARGRWKEVAAAAPEVADQLPAAEVLIRARVLAWAGEGAWRSGDRDEAFALWERALRMDSGVFRRIGLALPAEVLPLGGGDEGAYVAKMLRRSPRFYRASGGFQVTVDEAGSAGVGVCLRSPSGSIIRCVQPRVASVEDGGPEGAWARAQAMTIGAQAELFSLPLGLDRNAVRSLQRTVNVDEEAARERVRGAMESLSR